MGNQNVRALIASYKQSLPFFNVYVSTFTNVTASGAHSFGFVNTPSPHELLYGLEFAVFSFFPFSLHLVFQHPVSWRKPLMRYNYTASYVGNQHLGQHGEKDTPNISGPSCPFSGSLEMMQPRQHVTLAILLRYTCIRRVTQLSQTGLVFECSCFGAV